VWTIIILGRREETRLFESFDFFFLDLRAKNVLFEGISMSEKDEREKKKISFFFCTQKVRSQKSTQNTLEE
jgi:hypothetical protein